MKTAALEKVHQHFGWEEQLKKLREELLELVDEIDKGMDGNSKSFLREYADVLNVGDGIVAANGKEERLEVFRREKLQRTNMRIRSGYYDIRH